MFLFKLCYLKIYFVQNIFIIIICDLNFRFAVEKMATYSIDLDEARTEVKKSTNITNRQRWSLYCIHSQLELLHTLKIKCLEQ